MLSLKELHAAKIDPDLAREAHSQASARLADGLETKKSFEQKSMTLFGGYTVVALAMFGTSASSIDEGNPWLTGGLIVCGVSLTIGALLFVLALLDRDHGALGSQPTEWLTQEAIDSRESAVPHLLAYQVFHLQARIEATAASNKKTRRYVRAGIFIGLIVPWLLAICAIGQFFC